MGDQFVIDLQCDEKSFLGPFSGLIRYSCFHIGTNGSTKNRYLFLSTLLLVICILLNSVFALKAIVLWAFSSSKPMSLEWADANFQLGLALYGTFSGIALAYWTRHGFFDTFQDQLMKIRKLRVEPNNELDNYSATYKLYGSMFLLMFLLWIAFAFSGFLYHVERKDSLEQFFDISFNVNFTATPGNFFGTQPFIYIWMGLASSLASLVFALVQTILKKELNYFNQELQKASRKQELTDLDTFSSFGRRHIELMVLMKHVNAYLGVLMTYGSVGLLTLLVFSLYIFMVYKTKATFIYFVVTSVIDGYLYIICKFMFRLTGDIQLAVKKTASILLDDDSLQGIDSPKSQQTYRLFMDRVHHVSKLSCMNLIPIGEQFANFAVLVMPLVATIFAWYQRYLFSS